VFSRNQICWLISYISIHILHIFCSVWLGLFHRSVRHDYYKPSVTTCAYCRRKDAMREAGIAQCLCHILGHLSSARVVSAIVTSLTFFALNNDRWVTSEKNWVAVFELDNWCLHTLSCLHLNYHFYMQVVFILMFV